MSTTFKQLDIAVIGGGLGGLSAALSLRRAGHKVTVYERRGFAGEVGASISCAANGTQWLHAWGVDITLGKPVVLEKLTMRDWKTGAVLAEYGLGEYEARWGNVYNMFHRQDIHHMLLTACTQVAGDGPPVEVHVDYVCEAVDVEAGTASFANGETIRKDMIIGADGIRSKVRSTLGIIPDMTSAPQTCFRCNVSTAKVKELGLVDYSLDNAIQFWGGFEIPEVDKYFKIVMAPCSNNELVSFYCFMPTSFALQHVSEGFVFQEVPVDEILVGAYADLLDKDCQDLLKASVDRMPWRLYLHKPYPYWSKGKVSLLGDAAHPMMPHQSQGACQAIEDAAALGLIFSPAYPQFTHDVAAGLAMYERVRKPRATRVQSASRRATDDLHERIGFTSLGPGGEGEPLIDESGWKKLTIREMNEYKLEDHLRKEVEALVASRGGVEVAEA